MPGESRAGLGFREPRAELLDEAERLLGAMLLSQAHGDEQVCVDVDVVVSVDGDSDGDVAVGGSDHRHNRVSIPTIRSRRSSPRCFVVASTAFSTNNASSTAAHSIADPRAMA